MDEFLISNEEMEYLKKMSALDDNNSKEWLVSDSNYNCGNHLQSDGNDERKYDNRNKQLDLDGKNNKDNQFSFNRKGNINNKDYSYVNFDGNSESNNADNNFNSFNTNLVEEETILKLNNNIIKRNINAIKNNGVFVNEDLIKVNENSDNTRNKSSDSINHKNDGEIETNNTNKIGVRKMSTNKIGANKTTGKLKNKNSKTNEIENNELNSVNGSHKMTQSDNQIKSKKIKKLDLDEKNIHRGHRERMRKKYSRIDMTLLPEHQVLEYLLSFVQPQKDVNPLAHRLINEYGSLASVLDAKQDDLMQINGIGETLSCFLTFCAKLAEVYRLSKSQSINKLEGPLSIVNFFKNSVELGNAEKFYYICLDGKATILRFGTLGVGSASALNVDRKQFIKEILKFPTNSVIICHTHPNGVPLPSTEDCIFTATYVDALKTLDIELSDHIIISPEGYFSFFSNHMIADIVEEPLPNGKFVRLCRKTLTPKIFWNDNKEYKNSKQENALQPKLDGKD